MGEEKQNDAALAPCASPTEAEEVVSVEEEKMESKEVLKVPIQRHGSKKKVGMDVAPHKYNVFSEDSEAKVLARSANRVLLIVNPKSGGKKGLKILKEVKPVLESGGLDVTVKYTEYGGHAKEIAKSEDLSQVDILAIIGGDGSVHELVNGFLQRSDEARERVAVGIIPGGTGNTLAFDLNITSIMVAANILVERSTRKIDVLKVRAAKEEKGHEEVYAVNIVGYGLPSTVLKVANSLRFLGGAQYKLAAYQSLIRNKGYMCDVEYVDADGKEHKLTDKYVMIQAQATVHMGDRLAFAPASKLDNGLMELILIKHSSVVKMIKVMKAAEKNNGKHLQKKVVTSIQAKSFSITPHEKVKLQGENSVNVDGELVGMSPLTCDVMSRTLQIVSR